jgi:hypothetical protein
MKRSKLIQAVLFISLFSVIACTETPQEDNTQEYLIGRWDIQEASRNGRPTESLDQLYFEFFEDGSMNSNLTGSTQESKYTLEGKTVKQNGSPMDSDYAIEEISDSTLTMNTNIRGQIFRFRFQKQQLVE